MEFLPAQLALACTQAQLVYAGDDQLSGSFSCFFVNIRRPVLLLWTCPLEGTTRQKRHVLPFLIHLRWQTGHL
jgi:hypothetical protein